MIFTPYCSYFTIGKHEDSYQSNYACAVNTTTTWWVSFIYIALHTHTHTTHTTTIKRTINLYAHLYNNSNMTYDVQWFECRVDTSLNDISYMSSNGMCVCLQYTALSCFWRFNLRGVCLKIHCVACFVWKSYQWNIYHILLLLLLFLVFLARFLLLSETTIINLSMIK